MGLEVQVVEVEEVKEEVEEVVVQAEVELRPSLGGQAKCIEEGAEVEVVQQVEAEEGYEILVDQIILRSQDYLAS